MVSPRTKGFLLYLALVALITALLGFFQASAAQRGETLSFEFFLAGLLLGSYALFFAVDWMVTRRIEEHLDASQ